MRQLLLQQRVSGMFWRLGLLALIIGVVFFMFWPSAQAAQLAVRSITINSSQPSVVATHSFKFTIATPGNLGSIEFEYCTNSPLADTPCTAPPGLSVLAANLDSQTGATGFSIDPLTTANSLVLSRPVAMANSGPVSYNFSNITNPSVVNQSIYVRISTFASNDTSGSPTDTGGVVFDLSSGLGVGGFVPPRLVLCVGAVVALNCSNQTNDIKNLGDLSPKATGFTTTEFSVGTNDPGGYNVFVLGNTLTSGNNTIPAGAQLTTSNLGVGQFALNLVSNGTPAVGNNPIGAGTGTVASGYNSANHYKFQAGDLVASSPISTDYTLFTVSYIANVDPSQSEGVYSTTMTYLATAAF